ncbi:hypothetical protein KJY73_11300 [Bowmanella sp. Y26]|uniref:hypothetical protein n=1 Tax=Bowmanella yangjiangensis TaxID=2811230 RepID=UPI001BDBBCF2|nr:hypothetical protein [Bowmanella yangjiangensis]MBT1064165.1 hypothetical protein [Bowmanella yangjiangensis]
MKRIKFYALALMLVLLAGCGTSQYIYNVSGKQLQVNASSEQIEQAILDAAAFKRWTVKEKTPGHIILEINVRKHYASVSVDYDQGGYSIKYLDSFNLDYKFNKIHRNYNKWVKLLEMEIDQRLVSRR